MHELYGPEFLLERPLLKAIRSGEQAVLLIDELDRADDEFEAFLLEVLSDFTVTVPELGTIARDGPPAVVITSNRTRELHDALKRRCLYHWIDFPDLEREVEIIKLRVPGVSEQLARSVATTVEALRGLDLIKPPGAAEAIDWAQALSILGADVGERRRRQRHARLGAQESRRPAPRREGPARALARLSAAPPAAGEERLVAFGRALRDEGLAVGTGRINDFCRAASLLAARGPLLGGPRHARRAPRRHPGLRPGLPDVLRRACRDLPSEPEPPVEAAGGSGRRARRGRATASRTSTRSCCSRARSRS